MRTTLALSALAVTAFAFYVVSKTPRGSYGTLSCPPAETTQQALAGTQPVDAPPPDIAPFERPDPNQRTPAELAALSMEELLALDDDQFMTGVTRKLLDKRERQGFDALNPTEQTILRTEALGIRVMKDGFLAYYASPYGDFDATMRALTTVESQDMAKVFQRTLVAFGGGKPPTDEQERINVLSGMIQNAEMSPFEELDAAARQLIGGHAAAVSGYARKNVADLTP